MSAVQNPPYVIKPLPLPNSLNSNDIPIRPNIDDLNPDELNLFVETMRVFMAMDNLDDKTSYFRVAAIHGAPFASWDGCGSQGELSPGSNFCVHGEVTFPTFHHVYMMLFEQRVWETMKSIIDRKPTEEQPKLQEIYEKFRLPHWNWAVPKAENGPSPNSATDGLKLIRIPKICTEAMWDGKVNPMWGSVNPIKDEQGNPIPMGDDRMNRGWSQDYRIPADVDTPEGSAVIPWNLCTATSRYCTQADVDGHKREFVQGINDWTNLNAVLNEPQWYGLLKPLSPLDPTWTITEAVYVLLTVKFDSYAKFASTKFYDENPAQNAINIEYIHNNIHNMTGGLNGYQGHMNDVPVAAFDPIFWLHHCFIDELFAMWQKLNPNQWFDNPSPPPHPSSKPDPLSTDVLLPFHIKEDRLLYCSDDVRDINNLHYQYEQTKGSVEELTEWINKNLGVSRTIALNQAKDMPGNQNSYFINVIYNKFALGVPYTINFFFGDVEVSVDQLTKQSNYVGMVSTFGGWSAGCNNCTKQRRTEQLSRAQVPITVPLLAIALDKDDKSFDHLKLGAEDGNDLWAWLKKNLKYKIADRFGRPVDITDERLSELHITPMVARVTHEENRLSRYDEFSSLFTLNCGKQAEKDPWSTPKVSDRLHGYN